MADDDDEEEEEEEDVGAGRYAGEENDDGDGLA